MNNRYLIVNAYDGAMYIVLDEDWVRKIIEDGKMEIVAEIRSKANDSELMSGLTKNVETENFHLREKLGIVQGLIGKAMTEDRDELIPEIIERAYKELEK